MVTLLWIALTGYLLQKPQQIITNPNLTEAAMPDQVHSITHHIVLIADYPCMEVFSLPLQRLQ